MIITEQNQTLVKYLFSLDQGISNSKTILNVFLIFLFPYFATAKTVDRGLSQILCRSVHWFQPAIVLEIKSASYFHSFFMVSGLLWHLPHYELFSRNSDKTTSFMRRVHFDWKYRFETRIIWEYDVTPGLQKQNSRWNRKGKTSFWPGRPGRLQRGNIWSVVHRQNCEWKKIPQWDRSLS